MGGVQQINLLAVKYFVVEIGPYVRHLRIDTGPDCYLKNDNKTPEKYIYILIGIKILILSSILRHLFWFKYKATHRWNMIVPTKITVLVDWGAMLRQEEEVIIIRPCAQGRVLRIRNGTRLIQPKMGTLLQHGPTRVVNRRIPRSV